jgi:hypothetical protein
MRGKHTACGAYIETGRIKPQRKWGRCHGLRLQRRRVFEHSTTATSWRDRKRAICAPTCPDGDRRFTPRLPQTFVGLPDGLRSSPQVNSLASADNLLLRAVWDMPHWERGNCGTETAVNGRSQENIPFSRGITTKRTTNAHIPFLTHLNAQKLQETQRRMQPDTPISG